MAANRKAPAPPAISTTTAPDKPEPAVRLSPLFTPAFMYVMFAMVVLRRIYGPLPQFIAADLGTSVALVAQSLTVETIFSVAAALLISPLADSLGRRPVILVAIAVRTLGAGLIWLFPGIPTLFIGAALLGFGNGIVFPQIFSTVGDLFKSQPRDRLIAWLLVISRFAFLAGPLASGFLAEAFHWSAAFAAGSLVSVAALVLAWSVTPRGTTRPGSLPAVITTMAGAYRHLIGDRVTTLTLIANIVFVVGGYGIDVYFGAFVAFSYGLSPDQVGLLLTVGPAVAMISTWISGRIPARRRGWALVGASVIFSPPLAILLNFPVGPGFAIAMSAVWSFGVGLRSASLNATVLDLAPEHRGAITGLMQVSYSAGIMLGSALGGVALALGGYSAMGIFFSCCTLVSALLFAIAWRGIAGRVQELGQ
ncbi:MAG: MFS transporter [Chloroflexota bacterium]|nr:MFS transporter [Chloroflexota bacterium]